MKRIFTALMLTTLALSSFAQDAVQWGKDTKQAYVKCQFSVTIVLSWRETNAEDAQKTNACVQENLEAMKSRYTSLAPNRSAAAASALKDYYAAWIAAMNAVPRMLNMSKQGADRVGNSTIQRLDELWARYALEAGL